MEAKQRLKKGRLATNKISSRDEAVLSDGGSRCESVLFDFSEDGGAVATYEFGRKLPEGAIVTNVFSDEQTNFASAGAATLQLQAGSTDLTDAEAYSAYASLEERALASAADAVKITADSELKLDIAGAAITAGKVRFFVKYLLPNDQK